MKKDGSLTDKRITWTIDYTPWQNPSPEDGVAMDTVFELRDTIDGALHSYVDGSVTIDGAAVRTYTSRDQVDETAESYVLAEKSEQGESAVLIFGGTKFKAGKATQGNPAHPVHIVYQTVIRDELLLPGSGGGRKITNRAELFAGKDEAFQNLNISGSQTVTVQQPRWLSKTGTTTRHTDGSGSTTDWTVIFSPNGFSFGEENRLTLHDRLPAGSTLVENSLKVNGVPRAAVSGEDNGFTVSPMETSGRPVTVTYQTQVPEDMYDSGTSLGNNTAWFTFHYQDTDYTTPQVTVPVGSGDGSGTPGTATLVKTSSGYRPSTRTIDWTVTINPHRAWLRSGTFTDNLGDVGEACGAAGHSAGLELTGDMADLSVLIDNRAPTEEEKKLLEFTYSQQILTVTTGEIGAKTITFTYSTKVCDPCIFANNVTDKKLKNLISTEDMLIGKQSAAVRSASADCTVNVSAAVLTKKQPVYHYDTGKITWTVEVDAAGLPMTDVILEDVLPEGLTYVEGSLAVVPAVWEPRAETVGQKLKISLGSVVQKTTVTFDTSVEPEKAGFNSNEDVKITNTAVLKGKADNAAFLEVSHKVEQNFTNHGLVKNSSVNSQDELIRYEVLINPFGLSLPENSFLVDTLDKRLQLDMDTLCFYKAKLSGTTLNAGQKPAYTKVGDGQRLKPADYNPENNSFRVQLPVEGNSREAYVLTYTADIIKRQTGSYSNSVHFEGSGVLLGGSKNNSASAGGGGGGGGGVASRKAGIAITKTDSENQKPLEGVTFTLYQWEKEKQERGLPFARGTTDAQGTLSFLVKPGESYELVETEGAAGYDSTAGWVQLPEGVTETAGGLLITAGEAKSRMELELTNEPYKTDIVFRLLNESEIPMAGSEAELFLSDPTGQTSPVPLQAAAAAGDGTVRFSEIRCGTICFIRIPGGEILVVELPPGPDALPRIKRPDGTWIPMTAGYQAVGSMAPEQQWTLTVNKVDSGSADPLGGAVFGIYAEEECRTLLKQDVSGPDGILIFSGLVKGQEYWVKELEAPVGYERSDTVYQVNETGAGVTVPNSLRRLPAEPEEGDEPGTPGSQNPPGTSDSQNPSDAPDTPELPDPSESPDSEETPGTPESSAGSETSEGSFLQGASDSSGDSDAAVISGENEMSDRVLLTEAVEDMESRDAGDSSDGAGIPRTGNHTWLLAVIAVLSGIFLVIMTLYGFLSEKRNERK